MPNNVGFSSHSATAPRDTRLGGVDLVNQDLLNHFNILPGQVRGRPSFGCELMMLVGEPGDVLTVSRIDNAVRNVINYDPRVEFQGVVVGKTTTNGYSFACRLRYVEIGVVEMFELFVTGNEVTAA